MLGVGKPSWDVDLRDRRKNNGVAEGYHVAENEDQGVRTYDEGTRSRSHGRRSQVPSSSSTAATNDHETWRVAIEWKVLSSEGIG